MLNIIYSDYVTYMLQISQQRLLFIHPKLRHAFTRQLQKQVNTLMSILSTLIWHYDILYILYDICLHSSTARSEPRPPPYTCCWYGFVLRYYMLLHVVQSVRFVTVMRCDCQVALGLIAMREDGYKPIPVAAWSETSVCCRSLSGIAGSNPTGGMNVRFL